MCKQSCSNANVGRLYFQSVGDPNDISSSQKSHLDEETPEELRGEVKRLEGKVSGLTSVLEEKQKNLETVCAQLLVFKERLNKEMVLKDEALKQKATIQQLLQLKSQDLDSSALECKRLQERNMALAKELAAMKLVSDLSLEEDDVLKFASLGNDGNIKETIDVLKKSLVIRNKSYKELMTKCNILGRGEARSLNKLEKAKEKIKKLKERIQDLESAVERKENNTLRTLKASKEVTYNANVLNEPVQLSDNDGCLYKSHKKDPFPVETDKSQTTDMINDSSSTRKKRKLNSSDVLCDINLIETVASAKLEQHNHENILLLDDEYATRTEEREIKTQAQVLRNKNGVSAPAGPAMSNKVDANATMDDVVMLPYSDVTLSQALPRVRKETNVAPLVSKSGDCCFSGGLLGPDGTNWHLGKWCKRVHNRGQELPPAGLQGSTARAGDLIATGADGRGGKIKVLRSLDQPSLGNKENLTCTRKLKHGAKVNTLQSRGCLQIEHFFGRAKQS